MRQNTAEVIDFEQFRAARVDPPAPSAVPQAMAVCVMYWPCPPVFYWPVAVCR